MIADLDFAVRMLLQAFAAAHLVAAQLDQISSNDPILIGGTAVVLSIAPLLACLVPAGRAMLVNPTDALRTE
jgi:ABC-type lipoprotein release transport system permease subunit